MGLGVLVFHALASAQTAPLRSQSLYRKLRPVAAVVVDPSPRLMPPTEMAPAAPPVPPVMQVVLPVLRIAPPPARTPEQTPPRPPEVVWDGKQLSISCENSTLADILTAVRARTGAAIDIPPSAAAQRIATNLGPAPARQVLTSLLSSSDFDYIIQASEKNKDWLGSVVLTPRGKVDEEMANFAVPAAPEVRRMPRYRDSVRQTLEVPSPSASENVASGESTSVSYVPEPNHETSSPGAETASAVLQPSGGGDPQAVPLDPASAEVGGPPGASDQSRAPQPVAPPTSETGQTQPASMPQMVQDLQRLYQQRRQIQTQQNQTPSTPAN